jgi:hypothetical protein
VARFFNETQEIKRTAGEKVNECTDVKAPKNKFSLKAANKI